MTLPPPENAESSSAPAERWLRGLTVLLAVLFVLLFAGVALRRMRYPFEVDRMESGMLTTVWRLRHGLPLYTAPSLTWAPFLYAPLFFYVSAAATRLVGLGYLALRLVSTLATLGSFALIALFVHRETRRWAPALFATGLFASLYPFVIAWYDVGRVDSLALFFAVAALLSLRRGWALSAAILWWLAFLTKQTYLPLGLVLFAVDWRTPRRMAAGAGAYLLLVAGSIVVLERATQHWFGYYAFGTAGVIRWSFHTAVMFPFADLLGPLPIACTLILAAAALWQGTHTARPTPADPTGPTFYAVVTVVLTGAIWFVRAHEGANLNAVIPLYAWLSILAGISLHRLLAMCSRPAIFGPRGAALLPCALWLLAATQLAAHLYRPAEIPTGNLAARQAFLAALRSTPGDVWVADHSYDAILAGKPVHADMDAFDAVLGRHAPTAVESFAHAIETGSLRAIVLDRVPEAYQPPGLFTTAPFTNAYPVRSAAPGAGAQGDTDQPALVLLPCNPAPAPAGLTHIAGQMADRSHCP